MRRIHLVLLAAAAATGAGVHFAWRGFPDSGKSPPQKKPGLYAPDQIAANGVVEGLAPAVELRPEVGGIITAIHFRENDRVSKGDLLVELKNENQKEQVAVASSEVLVTRAALDMLVNGERPERKKVVADAERAFKAAVDDAEARWKRVKAEVDRGVGNTGRLEESAFALEKARHDYEKAKSERVLVEAPARLDELALAQARVRTAEARHRHAEAEYARTRLLAPADGTILQRFAEPGDMAGPATARPILVMADVAKLRVRAFVEELDAARVRLGQPAVVTADGLAGQEFRGTVRELLPRMGRRAPESDSPGEYKDVYFREVLVDLDERPELPINLRVRVRIDARAAAAPPTSRHPAPAAVSAACPDGADCGVGLFERIELARTGLTDVFGPLPRHVATGAPGGVVEEAPPPREKGS